MQLKLVELFVRLCGTALLCLSSQRPIELGIGGLIFVIIRQALWCVGACLSPVKGDLVVNHFAFCKRVRMSEVLGAVHEIDMRNCVCIRASEPNDKLNS